MSDTPASAKPGWKTTEFWLKVAAIALSAVFASGVTNDRVLAISEMASAALLSLGYTVSRTVVKAKAS